MNCCLKLRSNNLVLLQVVVAINVILLQYLIGGMVMKRCKIISKETINSKRVMVKALVVTVATIKVSPKQETKNII